MTTQAGTISGVPLDGSQQITVPFLSPYAQYVASVQLTFNPANDTNLQQVQGVVIGQPTVNGFIMEATGGTPGTTGNFTYIAEGF